MKKTLKILFVMLFALCTLIPSVYADFNDSDVVMTVNGNYYTSFQSGWAKAFSLAGTGDEAYVKLMADWIPYDGKFYVEDYRGYETGTKDGTLYIDLDGITLDLNGHIIDRNLASGDKGRVILVEGATLTITDTSADKNGKITGGYLTGGNRGAGVSVNNGNLILNGGSIYGNSAESGAGVYIKNSTFTVNGGSVSENYASKNVAGVYLDGAGAELIMNGGEISHNISKYIVDYYCGGVYAKSGSIITLNGGSINNNEGYNGSGVYLDGGTLNMLGGSINDNSSYYGGGIYSKNASKVIITGGKITGNEAYYYGGGIYHNTTEKLIMVDCEITGNECSVDDGGGVYVKQAADVYIGGTTRIINNKDYHLNPAFTADNLHLCESETKIYNALGQEENIPNKPLTEGAEIGVKLSDEYYAEDASFTDKNNLGFALEDVRFFSADSLERMARRAGNTTESGIQYYFYLNEILVDYDKYPVAKITTNNETTFYSDFNLAWKTATDISKNTPATLTLLEDWIAGNCGFAGDRKNDDYYSSYFYYGSLYLKDGSIDLTIDLNGHKIDRNLKPRVANGNAIVIDDGTLRIKDSASGGIITGAKDYSSSEDSTYGGAIYVYNGNLYIEGGEISGNNTDYGGGAILWESKGILCITGGKITGNYVTNADGDPGKGGGIYIFDWGNVYIGGDVIIDENYQADGKETNIYLQQKDVNLKHAVGQAKGVPNVPLREGAYIGIYAEDMDDLISEDNSYFNEDDYKYFHSDSASHYIRTVYDPTSASNAHKLYINSWTHSDVRHPGVKTVSVKDSNLLEDAVIDYDTQTITLTAHNTRRNFFEYAVLDDLITCTFDEEHNYIYGSGELTNLLTADYCKVMSDNGTYNLCKINVVPSGGEWADEQESVDNPYKMLVKWDTTIMGFTDFGEGWVYAVDQSQPVTITLLDDWVAPNGKFEYSKGTDSGRLHISGGDDITIDLNGNDINRNLSTATSNGQVFRLASGAKLTITDNSDSGDGKITGGYNSGDGGAFYIDYGKLYINGGEISGNKASKGAGIYGTNEDDTYVYINGGKVTGNTASGNGGGIYMNNGYLYVDGGEISGNNAVNGAGIYWASNNKYCLTGGVITGNIATDNGGGVYAADYGKMFLGGTVRITDNTNGNLYLSEKDVNIHNAVGKDGAPNKPLTEGAYIGITAKDKNDVISGGDSKFNEADYEYLYTDEENCFIQAVYDEDGGNHTNKIYYNEKSDTTVTVPSIEVVSLKSVGMIKVTLDTEARTIAFIADYAYKEGYLNHTTLYTHLNIIFDDEGTTMPDLKEYRDLTQKQKYMVLGSDGTYSIWTVTVEWACRKHSDEDENYICDICEEYLVTSFGISSYDSKNMEAVIIVPEAETYTVIFVDYEGGRVENVDMVNYEFSKGVNIVGQEILGFELGKGDKIMLVSGLITLTPLCEALVIE